MSTEAVAVVATSAVALATIGSQFLQQRRGHKHDRELSDLASVRGDMAEAAAVLHRMEYALDDALRSLRAWGVAFFEDEEREAPYKTLERVGREADVLRGRLRILFGPDHAVALAFDEANTAMLDAFRALWMVKMEPPAEQGTLERRESAQWVRDQGVKVVAARERFGLAQEQFTAAAHSAAGAWLPSGSD
ncbi:MAG TPA: hypothetical protein VKA53_05745 [Thermoanaerobaculia bacterium]|nr:hypothetical protein [Thermoanaerobaculia bacterium]